MCVVCGVEKPLTTLQLQPCKVKCRADPLGKHAFLAAKLGQKEAEYRAERRREVVRRAMSRMRAREKEGKRAVQLARRPEARRLEYVKEEGAQRAKERREARKKRKQQEGGARRKAPRTA